MRPDCRSSSRATFPSNQRDVLITPCLAQFGTLAINILRAIVEPSQIERTVRYFLNGIVTEFELEGLAPLCSSLNRQIRL